MEFVQTHLHMHWNGHAWAHTHVRGGRIVGKRRPVCPWLPSIWAGSLSSLNCDSHWHCLDGQLWWGGMLRQATGDTRKRIVGYVSLTRENKGQKKTEGDRAITGCVWRKLIERLFFAKRDEEKRCKSYKKTGRGRVWFCEGGEGEHKDDKAWQSNRPEKRVKEAIFYLNKKPGIRTSWMVSHSLVIMSLFLPRTTCLMCTE